MTAPAPATWPAPQPAQARPAARPRRRIDGIDMARALAILGMVMVHFGPYDPDTSDLLGQAYRASYGRASILFVLLAGVGVSLLFRGRGTGEAWQRTGWRALVFFPLGIALQALPTPVAVILHFYALYYLLGAIVARLPTGWLTAVTVVWTVVGPILFLTLVDPDLAGRGTGSTLTDPVLLGRDLLLTGYYPLLTWAPPLLVGVLVGRADLRDTATSAVLAVGGAITAAVAYGGSEVARTAVGGSSWLLAEGHSGAPLNVLGATGVAVAVLGVCLLVGAALPRVSWPLTAVGQLALTVYVLHLLVLAWQPEWLESRATVIGAVRKVGRFYLVTTLLCVAWRARFSRGPLEALLVVPFTAQAAMRRRAASDPAPGSRPDMAEGTGWPQDDLTSR